MLARMRNLYLWKETFKILARILLYKRTSWLIEKRDVGFARQTLAGPRARLYIRMNGKLKAPIRWRNAAEGAASGSVIQKIQK